jgi:Raf kinase inhibitor-like YbhB/YbcL family protein
MLALTTSVFAEETAQPTFTISSSSTLDGGPLPVMYTCDGKDVSPQLSWESPPAKAKSYALVMNDPDAPGGEFYHWIVFNIPKSATSLDEGVTSYPAGAKVGKNSFGNAKYNGPCPPKGTTHSYAFTLYALDADLNLQPGSNTNAVLAAMKNHIVGTAKFTPVYSRWG